MPVEHQQMAEELLAQVQNGEVQQPTDIVRSWVEMPSWDVLNEACTVDFFEDDDVELPMEQKSVPVNRIIGSHIPNHFELHKIERVLQWIAQGTFQPHHSSPPSLTEFEGNYYIRADGTHRVLACKAVGIPSIFADVQVIPTE